MFTVFFYTRRFCMFLHVSFLQSATFRFAGFIKDPYKQCASVRDGALACLVGIAARNSIATGQPVKIADLTSIQPQEKKLYQRIL